MGLTPDDVKLGFRNCTMFHADKVAQLYLDRLQVIDMHKERPIKCLIVYILPKYWAHTWPDVVGFSTITFS